MAQHRNRRRANARRIRRINRIRERHQRPEDDEKRPPSKTVKGDGFGEFGTKLSDMLMEAELFGKSESNKPIVDYDDAPDS